MESHVVYSAMRMVNKCNSSVLVRTWRKRGCMQSMAGSTKNQKRKWTAKFQPITSEYLDYNEVMEKYDTMMDWICDLYVNH